MGQQTNTHFIFTRYEARLTEGTIDFHYTLQTARNSYNFTERLTILNVTKDVLRDVEKETLSGVLQMLHLVLGISYWKTYSPKKISIETYSLTRKQADFWNILYTKGLGEFYYKNSIDFRKLLQFPFDDRLRPQLPRKSFMNRSLVLLGAGKDSIVTSELLAKSHKEFSLFTLNKHAIQSDVAGILGKPAMTVGRLIDPQLFQLNKEPQVYNGHIPITAIYMMVGVLSAVLFDYRYVISSNEESANYGNVRYLGEEVNHQWSKSFEFELLLQEYIKKYISPDLNCFSFLRPVKEIRVAEIFCNYPKFFEAFTSCNTNFKIAGIKPSTKWCGVCPKCAFVFLILAAFLPKETVVTIFNKNLLSDISLLGLYKQLIGVEGFKPFECVGTPEESLYAFAMILKRGEFHDDIVIKTLLPSLTTLLNQKPLSAGFARSASDHHNIPSEFISLLPAI
ncbi:MAG TPA: hypothetical protein VMR81_04560 [Patescibacteria group bacterium]|nr:hypothetical protein [Patescibacteria group bacterium]